MLSNAHVAACDPSQRKSLTQSVCVWEFREPIAAFTEGTGSEPVRSIRQKAKHIEILRDAKLFPRDDYPWRPREELEQELDTWGDWPVDVETALDEDPAQLELAFLVANSPDLQTFIMDGHHKASVSRYRNHYILPVWLFPIIQVAWRTPLKGMDDSFYRNLQTLDINMQFDFGPGLTYLFLLPTLRTLRLSCVECSVPFQNEADWPIKSRSSSVASLILDGADISGTLIRLLITSCRKLSCFKFKHVRGKGRPLSCSAEIMSGLAQQQDSLRTLHFDPSIHLPDRDDMTYTRTDDFWKLHALERLCTPFSALLGEPQSTYTGEESWQYPQMRDVLPHRLQELSLNIVPMMLSQEYDDGYPSLFSSALPSDMKDLHLKRVYVRYDHLLQSELLLFDFWDIKKVFLEQGVDFDYTIRD
ncbi:hypothetical protein GT037_005653 [Alternaria burnsii]|uniref:Uncharacterized protein n=1 Tax=Alternaria burnsii TaxID=1187904 RepID=A0A8H7EFS3_9PLEO|nr:uncharacterized protein GT037_005653 [Alternaria burnsii]KAF7676148.1 hypothetical protein GT037_005653 [Alternaria burnsii]